MSNILRRPMFRGGGAVSSQGTGITSGLAPRQNYKDGDVVESYKEKLARLQAEQPKMTLGDYLQIAATGLDIAGRPSEGGGISGALTTAAGPLANLGRGLAQSQGQRAAGQRELAGTLTGLEVEKEIGMARAMGDFEKRKAAFNALYDTKKQSIMNDTSLTQEQKDQKLAELERNKSKDFEFYIIKGGDVSDFFKLGSQTEAIEAANKAAKNRLKAEGIDKNNPEYAQKFAQYSAEYLAQFTQQFGQQFADGGRVGYQEGGEVVEQTTQAIEQPTQQASKPQPMMLSYDELRARLPEQITDDIVNLLASSYEALADFAEIQTQADVNQFNQKYQVQLVLPQEA